MSYLTGGIAIFLSLTVLFSVIWIIFPAPSYYIWLYSVAVSEWSLWFGIAAWLGIIFAVINRTPTILYPSLIIGGAAFLISLYPYSSSLSAAEEKGVSLSFAQYFAAVTGGKQRQVPFQTRVFASRNNAELKVDIYLPNDTAPRRGTSVIVIHGGAWSGGVRNDFPQWNSWLAENGLTVFDIDYTLAPQPNYLSAIADVKSAVEWVRANSPEFNVSPDKIVLLGRSAGAHLALITAYSGTQVKGVISLYGPADLIWDYDNLANEYVIDGRGTLSAFLGGSPHQSPEMLEKYLFASPIEHISPATPPTLLIHGGKDQLVRLENMHRLSEKLNGSNVINETVYIPYGQHGFDYNINGWGSQITRKVILRFVNSL